MKKKNFFVILLSILIIVLFFAIGLGGSWLLTCGIIKLICLCFGLEFKWLVATGFWLILLMLSSMLTSGENHN